MTDRIPPHDPDAEKSVIGSCLLSRQAIQEVIGLVGPTDFYRPAHETLFRTIVEMDARGEPIDPMTVNAELARRGELQRVGGAAYLHEVVSFPPTPANASYYAARVAEVAVYRRAVNAGVKITQMAYDAMRIGGEADHVTESAKDIVDEVGGVTRAQVTMFSDVTDHAIDTIGKARFTPTPWRRMNRFVYGWQPAHMYSVSARPATGKTVFTLQACIDAAMGRHADPLNVAYYTMEMSGSRLFQRGIAYLSGVDYERMLRADVELTDPEWAAVSRAAETLRPLPIVVEDASGWSAEQIAAHAKATNRRMPLDMIIIDHIGRVAASDRGMNEAAVLKHAADVFLDLGHRLNAAVIVVTQLNRGSATGEPKIEDIRGSDVIEQNSDVSILLDRDKINTPEVLKVAIPKNRDGQSGKITLRFDGPHSRILDPDPQGVPPRPLPPVPPQPTQLRVV